MNPDPDYSAAYVILRTDAADGLEGHGFTFTIGRGTEVVVAAIRRARAAGRRPGARTTARGRHGRRSGATSSATASCAGSAPRRASSTWRRRRSSTPSGTCARSARASRCGSCSSDMTPERARRARRLPLPHRRADAGRGARACSRAARRGARRARGAAARATATRPTPRRSGWLGYDDDKIAPAVPRGAGRRLDAVQAEGRRRRRRTTSAGAAIVREQIGPDRMLAVDANQRWDVREAIEWMARAGAVRPVLDRGAHQPGRHPRPRGDRPRRRADPRRHRRARPQPGDVQAAPAGRTRSRSARSTPAGWAASTRSSRSCCWPRSSACRSARTPAASGCASWSSTSPPFDYIAVSGRLEGRVIEYVDHLHEHFLDPVVDRAAGATGCRPRPATAQRCGRRRWRGTGSPMAQRGDRGGGPGARGMRRFGQVIRVRPERIAEYEAAPRRAVARRPGRDRARRTSGTTRSSATGRCCSPISSTSVTTSRPTWRRWPPIRRPSAGGRSRTRCRSRTLTASPGRGGSTCRRSSTPTERRRSRAGDEGGPRVGFPHTTCPVASAAIGPNGVPGCRAVEVALAHDGGRAQRRRRSGGRDRDGDRAVPRRHSGRAPQAGMSCRRSTASSPSIVAAVRSAFPGHRASWARPRRPRSHRSTAFARTRSPWPCSHSDGVDVTAGLSRRTWAMTSDAACRAAVGEARAPPTREPKLCVVLAEGFVVDPQLTLDAMARALPPGVVIVGGDSARRDFGTRRRPTSSAATGSSRTASPCCCSPGPIVVLDRRRDGLADDRPPGDGDPGPSAAGSTRSTAGRRSSSSPATST